MVDVTKHRASRFKSAKYLPRWRPFQENLTPSRICLVVEQPKFWNSVMHDEMTGHALWHIDEQHPMWDAHLDHRYKHATATPHGVTQRLDAHVKIGPHSALNRFGWQIEEIRHLKIKLDQVTKVLV